MSERANRTGLLWLLLALLTCLLAGCASGNCKDGQGGGLAVWGRSYKACDHCCIEAEAQKAGVDVKNCRCSTSCPCWKSHK